MELACAGGSTVKTILSDTLQNITQFAASLVVYGSPLPEKGGQE
jgi:hypothetical protein